MDRPVASRYTGALGPQFIAHRGRNYSYKMASQLSFTGFAWKNLWRRRLRTILTLGGIAMAIGAFVALVGFSRSFEREWLRLYSTTGTDIAVVERTFINTSMDESLVVKIEALPMVAKVSP